MCRNICKKNFPIPYPMIGGMGIIVLAIAILPLLGIGGMQLFSAKSPGPSADKLKPRITSTAKRLWFIYLGYTLAETLLLRIASMSMFDAMNHALSTMATGGFSTKNASAAYWNDNPLIQYIIIVFMFQLTYESQSSDGIFQVSSVGYSCKDHFRLS